MGQPPWEGPYARPRAVERVVHGDVPWTAHGKPMGGLREGVPWDGAAHGDAPQAAHGRSMGSPWEGVPWAAMGDPWDSLWAV